MGSIKDPTVKTFCDDVYTELAGIKMKIDAMTEELVLNYGEDHKPFDTYQRHLRELSDQIEWKLQILSHACSYDWKGARENIESNVSVSAPDVSGPEFSGGYIGG